ncbi:MAG: cell surface protein SprA, partial [Gemmatimonadetes bacterium]|nr:cell surface protein SprA [Gemmatimonadota bacterium]
DMEGVEDSRELSITRGVWSPASEPVGPASDGLDRSNQPALPFNWYNPENIVRRQEVFTELSDQREGQDFIQVLEFAVRDSQDVNTSDPDSTGWMGVMRNLSTTGEDFSEKKFLEIWVNDFGVAQGKLIFDMGEISEDFYTRPPADSVSFKGRGFLDTEDVDPYDGDLTVSREDFGLDNVQGNDDLNVPGDDGNDDFEFRRSTKDFSKINNYEGNSLLDTEDLDGDNFLDEDNAYFSYVFDLADTTVGTGALVLKNYDPVERPDNHWRLYRLPLDDGVAVGGVPRLRSVKYARLWADGLADSSGVKVQVASVKIVGAAWLEEKISTNDTVEPIPDSEPGGAFRVNVVNNKEDNFYFPPFDPGEDINNEQRREQSLVMDYVDIPSDELGGGADSVDTGRQGSAYKQVLDTGQGRSQDFTQYESLSFFFRDGRAAEGGGLREGFSEPSSGTMFFRFGPDTTNFYEFSTARLTAGEDAAWREVFIEMQPLTELKLDPPEKLVTVEGRQVEYRSTVVDGDTLAVYGAPTLARVRRMTLGVRGDDPSRSTISGEIWVNEIRLRSVMKDTGYASRLTGNARFADLLTASGGMRKLDSEFRRIEGDRHGTNEYSWNVRGDLKLNKFFDGLGVSLPVTGDYSYSETTPRLAPNSDIELIDEADKIEARSTTRRQGVSSRFAKTRPSRNPFLRYTVDNLSVNGSRNTSSSRTPFLVSEDETITGAANYNLSPGQNRTFRVAGFNVSYFPTLQLGLNGRQSFRESADIREDSSGTRFQEVRDPVRTRSLEGSMGVQWDPIRSNTFDTQFSFNKRQDLDLKKDLGLLESVKEGSRELRRDHKSRVSWRPGVVRWLRPVLSYDTNYIEDRSPAVQTGSQVGDPLLRRVENSNTREISTSISPRQIFRENTSGGRSSRGRATRNRARDEQIRNKGNTQRGGEVTDPTQEGKTGQPGDAADGEGQDGESGETGDGEETEGTKRPGLGDLWNGFTRFARSFGDLRYTYRDNRSSRFSRVGDRPTLQYQFGFQEFDRGLQIPGSNLIEDNTSATFSNRFDTSWNPTQTFYLDTAYARSVSRSVRNSSRTKTLDVTWPDLSVNVDGLEKWRLFQRWAKTSSVNGSFRRQTTR